MSGTARPSCRGSAAADRGQALDAGQRPRIRDLAADRRRCGSEWTGEERPSALPLAAFEVPVRGADGVLAGCQLIAVHGNAHGAAGLTPLRAGGPEDLVEALPLGLALHLIGARHDHHPDAVGDLPIAKNLGG